MTFKQIRQELAPELERLNLIIEQALSSPDTPLMDTIVRQYLQTKGKQIRPVMVLLSARLFGTVSPAVLHGAAALEMLHNASLIHDDVVDETSTRRSRPTVNATWDNHIAVLVGDFFVSAALQQAVATGSLDIVKSLSMLGKELSQGEIHQICNARDHSLQIDPYIRAIHKKTASLFMHCAMVGAHAMGRSMQEAAPLVGFAELLGLCFQIRDDIFDYCSDQCIGKPTGNDLREGKITLPLLLALQNAPARQTAEITAILGAGIPDTAQIARIISFAHTHGGIRDAYTYMENLHRRALPQLEAYPDSPTRRALQSLFQYIIARDH